MSLDLAGVIRIKGAIDRALEVQLAPSRPSNPGFGAWVGAKTLVQTYKRAHALCVDLVEDTDVEIEFLDIFPTDAIEQVVGSENVESELAGDVVRLLLAQLSGWLGSWPSAEQLLNELITALEQAEATSTDPDEKSRLRAALDTLTGAGRDIAVGVVTGYLQRVI
jgi:hypothetical protein